MAARPVAAPSELAAAFGLDGAVRRCGPRGRRSPPWPRAALADDPAETTFAPSNRRYLRLPRGLDQLPAEAVRWL